MPKRFLYILLLFLAVLAACTSTDATPTGGDVLAPLPTDSSNPSAMNADLPTLTELIAEDSNLVFFANGLNSVGLTDDLQNDGPFTVFAMSNVAFSTAGLIVSQTDPALLGSIIDSHVVNGAFSEADLLANGSVVSLAGSELPISQAENGVKVWYAPLIGEARPASNGMLYVIETMLLPPETGPEMSMWGALQADGRFTTFVSHLEGTSTMGVLRFGQFFDAVLAPTDDAFAAMPTQVATFLQNDPLALSQVITIHLLAPDGWPQGVDLTIAELAAMEEVQTRITIQGSGFAFGYETLPISTTEAGVQIGDAGLVEGDIDATNGVIHAIDTVLIPQLLLEDIPQP